MCENKQQESSITWYIYYVYNFPFLYNILKCIFLILYIFHFFNLISLLYLLLRFLFIFEHTVSNANSSCVHSFVWCIYFVKRRKHRTVYVNKHRLPAFYIFVRQQSFWNAFADGVATEPSQNKRRGTWTGAQAFDNLCTGAGEGDPSSESIAVWQQSDFVMAKSSLGRATSEKRTFLCGCGPGLRRRVGTAELWW